MKKIVTVCLCLILVLLVLGVCVFRSNYVLVNGKMIERTAVTLTLSGDVISNMEKLQRIDTLKTLDIRECVISIDDYEQLCEHLPNCDILWSVPFQGEFWDNNASEVAVKSVSPEDLALLNYFPNLKTVDARTCRDYDALLQLQSDRPDLTVMYCVDLGAERVREDARTCTVSNENVRLLRDSLQYLPSLTTVNAEACTDYDTLLQIQALRPELTLNYVVAIGQMSYPCDSASLTLDIADAKDALEKLQYFSGLTRVSFTGLATDPELMYQMMCRYPDVVIDWNFELFGVETGSMATELLLNEIPMESTQVVEDALKYFYNLQRVEMCQCGIPSEEMDALWKRHPETRFVWAIPMGSGYVRTDVKAFIPFKYGYNIDNPFYDTQAKELKYLVDLECLDIGHMRMKDISFLEYMPKLRYLIVADTEAEDYSVIGKLKDLIYLELFIVPENDPSFLLELTKLEDLNVGKTFFDDPLILTEMTWLKRLWAINTGLFTPGMNTLIKSLPDTVVVVDGKHPTDKGWRQSPNYFDMRDMLGMFYMK